MPHDLELEPARTRDAGAIARMSRVLIEYELAWRWTPQAVAARIGAPDSEVVVARRGRAVVGFALMDFRFDERRAHLTLLAVAPAERRHGLGRDLVEWLERMARPGGIDTLRLEVRASNGPARAFYRALGWREVSRHRGYYQDREDALVLERSLRAAPASGSRVGG